MVGAFIWASITPHSAGLEGVEVAALPSELLETPPGIVLGKVGVADPETSDDSEGDSILGIDAPISGDWDFLEVGEE